VLLLPGSAAHARQYFGFWLGNLERDHTADAPPQ